MYTVRKISITSPIRGTYDYELSYPNWKSLVRGLAYRNDYANEVFHGRGANVFRYDELIGHTDDFNRIDRPFRQITLSEFVEEGQ